MILNIMHDAEARYLVCVDGIWPMSFFIGKHADTSRGNVITAIYFKVVKTLRRFI